jgi:DNA-binding transcriptional regulator YdaS (Cro superfamily)
MRNLVILGASALVLALGVAQASASQNGNSVADYRAAALARAASAQPAYTGELRDFRGQPVDQDASRATNFPTLSANERHG